jgi:hypothetical protein
MVRAGRVKVNDKTSSEDAIRHVWVIYETVPKFLTSAFLLPKWADDYKGFLESGKGKRGSQAVPEAAASFLEKMADKFDVDERDDSFVLPNSFRQYRETENWPSHN